MENQTTTKKTSKASKNVYQKLIEARSKFLSAGIQKSGKNMQLSFKYFELEDIVPVAIPIFEELGLVNVISFTSELATMTIINCDAPDETIVFTSPMEKLKPIIGSSSGKSVTNDMQLLGATETYQRRYLYYLALDIVENDTLDSVAGRETQAKPQPNFNQSLAMKNVVSTQPKAPVASAETRDNIQNKITNQANDLQIGQIRKLMEEAVSLDPAQNDIVLKILASTNNLENISASSAATLITQLVKVVSKLKIDVASGKLGTDDE